MPQACLPILCDIKEMIIQQNDTAGDAPILFQKITKTKEMKYTFHIRGPVPYVHLFGTELFLSFRKLES